MTNQDRERVRRNLLARRRALLARWKDELEGESELLEARSADWGDLSALQRDASVLERMADAEVRAMGEIHAAIQRLDEGRYGNCERCGEAIEGERLRALPEARVCSRCAGIAEQQWPH